MATPGDTPKHKTSDRMAERAERWAADVAEMRAAEALRVAGAYAPIIYGQAEAGAPLSMRDKVRQAQVASDTE